jgi:hypothetical protein
MDGTMTNLRASLVLIGCGLLLAGCAGRAQLWPNSDPALRRTSTQFAADAAKRFPYKADAPRGGTAIGRAQVGYTLNKIEILNNSDQDWNDVEVWINKAYVVHLPVLKARADKVTTIPFQAIFNDQGQSFPTDNSKILVNKVEVYYGGKMYDVPSQMAD